LWLTEWIYLIIATRIKACIVTVPIANSIRDSVGVSTQHISRMTHVNCGIIASYSTQLFRHTVGDTTQVCATDAHIDVGEIASISTQLLWGLTELVPIHSMQASIHCRIVTDCIATSLFWCTFIAWRS